VGAALIVGVVSQFDEARGLGSVRGDSGGEWPFHCTQISDGTRSIEAGRRVAFEVVASHLGRMEAVRVTKI
jgi:cold shock CspA family protein